VLNFGAAGAADAASLEAAELTYNSGAHSSAAAAGPAEPIVAARRSAKAPRVLAGAPRLSCDRAPGLPRWHSRKPTGVPNAAGRRRVAPLSVPVQMCRQREQVPMQTWQGQAQPRQMWQG
jgi:hypothetical protein